MYEIDKEKFGAFLTGLRREKGMTQKDLAARLYVSDKAVSKWERGLSLPDVSLLTPLGETLGVTVTELLRGERTAGSPLDPDEVEELVTAAVRLSGEERERRAAEKKKWRPVWFASLAVSAAELWLLYRLGLTGEELGNHVALVEGLCLLFGGWLCLFARDVLPGYYDQGKISFYADGPFRMNLAGVHFNNRNWPHILRAMRLWTTVTPVVYPALYWVLRHAVPAAWGDWWTGPLMRAACLGLVLPAVIQGKRYE